MHQADAHGSFGPELPSSPARHKCRQQVVEQTQHPGAQSAVADLCVEHTEVLYCTPSAICKLLICGASAESEQGKPCTFVQEVHGSFETPDAGFDLLSDA